MQGLLCFDYDRTLLDHATGKIPKSALEAIDRARPYWKIAIATGRDMRLPDSQYGVETVKPDALIHMNGARVLAEGNLLCHFSWPQELLGRVLAFARKANLCVGCQLGTTYYTTNEEKLQKVFQNGIYAPPERILPAEDLLGQEPSALVLLGPAEDAARLQKAFPNLSILVFAHSEGADIVPYHLSKADGMRRLCEYYGLTPDQVIVFGDSANDLELFRAAGLSVAMGNAIPAVKEAADFVTKAIDQDGIAHAIRVLGLLEVENLGFTLGPMEEAQAKEVAQWRYPAPYDVYNFTWEEAVAGHWAIADEEARASQFFVFRSGDWKRVEAFLRVQRTDDGLALGFGMAPSLCGRGRGARTFRDGLRFLGHLTDTAVRAKLEVRASNERAVRCFEACGFQQRGEPYEKIVRGKKDTFLSMQRVLFPISL